jgi:hypothetical protein
MAKKAVIALVSSQSQAESIVDELRDGGFANADISVLFPDQAGTSDFAFEKNTKAPEGGVAGAGAGGLIGGTLGLLAGIGTLAIPGLGPFIAAGPIMAALSGAAAGAAVGGITGALIGMGMPEVEAKRYAGKVEGGDILLSVHVDDSDETSRAKSILEEGGARDISTTGEANPPSKPRRQPDSTRNL